MKKSNKRKNTSLPTTDIHMRSKMDFEDLKNNHGLQKNGRIYQMLKHGPIPNGDYSFLVSDGKLTDPAKWLLLACELNLDFLTLCVLVKAFSLHNSFKEKKLFATHPLLELNMLYASFEHHMSHKRIMNIITCLIELDYIEKLNYGLIKINQKKLDALLKSNGNVIKSLMIYVEKNIYRIPGITIKADHDSLGWE